jgi:hypothetical protein
VQREDVMALDFPSSPAVGQAFAGRVWDGAVWDSGAYPTALPKNYVLNSAMQISEENGNTAVSAGAGHVIDQWQYTSSPGTAQRVASVTPRGSPYRIRLTPGTTGTANAYFTQYIEGSRIADLAYGTAQARSAVLRFGVKAAAATYSVGLRNGLNSRAIALLYSVPVSNVDTEISIAVPPSTIAGGWASDNTLGLSIWFMFSASANLSPTPGVWTSTNQIGAVGTRGDVVNGEAYELFDVGLYADPYATGKAPPFKAPEPARELRRCQRYWYRCVSLRGASASATNFGRGGASHPVPMRVAPAFTIVGGAALVVYDGTQPAATAVPFNGSNTYAVDLSLTTSGLTIVRQCTQFSYNSDTAYLAANARM